jgi:hypothetical protein
VQYEWQAADRVGREAIARAIAMAEAKMEDYLGFRLKASYEVAERHALTGPYHPELVNWTGKRVGGYQIREQLRWGFFIGLGVRATTLLPIIQQGGPPADLVWVTNQPGYYWEVARIVIDATGVTDPDEIHVFYPGHGTDPEWEIRPINVTLDTNTHQATLLIRRELMVLDTWWDTITPEAPDGTVDANFLTTIAAYRVYTDTTTQATLRWDEGPWCTCDGAGTCIGCTQKTSTACGFPIGDQRISNVGLHPAVWNADTMKWEWPNVCIDRMADDAEVNYFAGWQNKNTSRPLSTMDLKWREAVAWYAAALLERPPCDCNPDFWEHWREDLTTTFNPRGGQITNVGKIDLANPFGTRRGMIEAWRRVTDGDAVSVGVKYR